MTRLSALCSVLVMLLAASFSHPVDAQVATGTPPFGTFSTPGPDVINIGNLNMFLNIPVLNKAGRGTPLTYNLAYNSSVWYPVTSGSTTSWTPVQQFGWQGLQPAGQAQITYQLSMQQESCLSELNNIETTYTVFTYEKFVYVDSSGNNHEFSGAPITFIESRGISECAPTTSRSTPITESALDGSGYTISITPFDGFVTAFVHGNTGSTSILPVVSNPSASQGTESITDSNGNEITVTNGDYTDTTGVDALNVIAGATSTSLTYKTATGASASYVANYSTYTVQTAFGCSGVGEYGPTTVSLVSSVSLPDGSSYAFNYEPTPGSTTNVTGRVSSITLPSGGTIAYTYTGGSHGIVCADGSTAGLTRTTEATASSPASTWTYTRTPGAGTSQTAVVDGLGNNQVYNFINLTGQEANYIETQRMIYQSAASGTPLLTRQTCYNGTAPPCLTSAVSAVEEVDTYETLNGMAMHGATAIYNTSGLQTTSEIYDYGTTTARGPLLRQESWTYGTSIPGLVTQDIVRDGSGNLAGETVNTYDGSTPTASSGVPQHIAVTGTRGNLTSVQQFASSGTSYTTTMTYEDTGTLLSSTGPNGTTTYSYDPTFTYNTGWAPPTPSSGVSQPGSGTYDTTNTGMPLSTTDANGAKTSIASYDSFWRPTEVDSFNSSNTQLAKSTASYTQNLIQQNTFQNASTSGETQTELDAYGRVSRSATANGQSTNPFYQQDTCYNANGNTSFVSTRYQGAGFSTNKVCASTGNTLSYDALGRVLSVQHADGTTRSFTYIGRATRSVDENGVTRISQVDGLGRLTIVCEISSNSSMPNSGSPIACGTDIGGTGFTTTYAYTLATPTTTVTQGAQTRTFQTDWLGRTTSVTEPERGTTNYSYAYNSTGLVVTRTRPTANQTSPTTLTTTTTQSDALGRPTSVSYSDGTPTKTYLYDINANLGNGLVQTNYIGRLSAAFAQTPSSLLALTGFSYDGAGRVLGLLECLPSGCATATDNLLLSYQYDLAGNMLSAVTGPATTLTYTYSPANEVQSVTSSLSTSEAPSNVISSATNGPFGPLSYQLGNGLTSVATYDALGRAASGFVCNGSSVFGCTGGSFIYGQSITRQGVRVTQGCDTVIDNCANFGYDEFNRLTSRTVAGSSTPQNYTYGYDRYGNRWSQTAADGGPSPQLTFSSTTNRITSAGYSYDAAGNVTSDGFHTYTYDAEGNVTAVDGGSTASYVYNALNQRVSETVGGATTQFAYNVAGQRVSIWNTASPAGELQEEYYVGNKRVAYFANNMLHFQHQDWTGTERMRTTFNGAVEGTYTSMSFGDAFATVSGSDGDPYHFSMLDHDYSSDTDHAQFRQYSSTPGRWMSPDPYDGSYDPSNPQSMNRYSYVLNNPMEFVDPLGLLTTCDQYSKSYEIPFGGTFIIVDEEALVCFDDGGGGSGGSGGSGSGSGAGGGAGGGGSGTAPNKNPCAYAGTAKTPRQYAAAGQSFKNSYVDPVDGNDGAGLVVGGLLNLYSNFQKGGTLDAQPYASGTGLQRASYGNYAYGAFFAGAGFSLQQTLSAASLYGYKQQILNGAYQGRNFGPDYGGIPIENVQDITAGYSAQMNGMLCHT
jgi:RHS repeat-associated protein